MIGPTVVHIVLVSLSAVCCYFFFSNWVSHHAQRNLQTHHTILATLLISLLWLVVCIVHHRHHFMTDGTSNTEEVTGNFDAASLPSVDRSWWLHCKYSRRAIIKINPSWLFVLLIFLIDGTYKSDWHVCLDYCNATTANTVRWVSSQVLTLVVGSCLSYCMGVRPNKQATICVVMLFSIINNQSLILSSRLLSSVDQLSDNSISCSSSL